MLNHAITCSIPYTPELTNSIHKWFRAHLCENRIKLLNNKLVCYVSTGGNDKFVMLIIIPQDLCRIVFDAYHASGVGDHLGINKTIVALRFYGPTYVRTSLLGSKHVLHVSKLIVSLSPVSN